MPNAKKFKHWITSEVLPTIRKHGAYMTTETLEQALTSPDFLIRLATELKNEKEKRLLAEKQIENNKPKVLFYDSVASSDSVISVGDLAKLLNQNGISIGRDRLFEYLRENDYLIKSGISRNMPTQKSMELGLFKVKEYCFTINNEQKISTTTLVTAKGQQYFINHFLNKTA